MARYSSDSDSDRSGKYRKKHYRRSRSSSSDSSDSSSYRKRSSKYSKSRRHRRSRSKSRDNQRSSKSYKSSRGSSRDRDRHRYKSPERNKKKTRSASREKSTSRSSSSQSYVKSTTEKNVNILAKGFLGFSLADEFTIEPRINESVLDEINASGFTQKQFTSSAHSKEKKTNKNIVIDITADTIQVPPAVKTSSTIHESIFHTSIMMDQDARFDKWVKKLFNLRQKAIVELFSTATSQ
ncbi:serine/Arginine-related protein 53 isoform X1 [Diachasma alloeum]|uniref:serine/Arginine-related protein 53 isoform X1 n=1 Tax=Diachasma alloeum TaxID=454923 RepID=UPI0007382B7D|nr:serine/Arginine-related protein 53 isoform X1 [Diachasma alloeum]